MELRRRLADSGAKVKALAAEFRTRVGSHPAKDAAATQKVLRDFQSLLRSAERLMETAKAREAASLPRPSVGRAAAAAAAQQDEAAAARAAESERAALLETQRKKELLAVEAQLTFNEAIIEERDAAIGQITGQIGEVHQIFQDLAVLVSDQGAQVRAWCARSEAGVAEGFWLLERHETRDTFRIFVQHRHVHTTQPAQTPASFPPDPLPSTCSWMISRRTSRARPSARRMRACRLHGLSAASVRRVTAGWCCCSSQSSCLVCCCWCCLPDGAGCGGCCLCSLADAKQPPHRVHLLCPLYCAYLGSRLLLFCSLL